MQKEEENADQAEAESFRHPDCQYCQEKVVPITGHVSTPRLMESTSIQPGMKSGWVYSFTLHESRPDDRIIPVSFHLDGVSEYAYVKRSEMKQAHYPDAVPEDLYGRSEFVRFRNTNPDAPISGFTGPDEWYQRHRTIARFLGTVQTKKFPRTREEVRSEITIGAYLVFQDKAGKFVVIMKPIAHIVQYYVGID